LYTKKSKTYTERPILWNATFLCNTCTIKNMILCISIWDIIWFFRYRQWSKETFSSNMRSFGLGKDLCLEFLRKQSTIGNLKPGIIVVLIHMLYWWGLWFLMPLSTIFQLYRGSQFIGRGNRSTRRKPLTCRKSLTILMPYELYTIYPSNFGDGIRIGLLLSCLT
jgi:hypothetical protein